MIQIIKGIFALFSTAVFIDENEANPNHPSFNVIKMVLVILLTTSVFMNIWMLQRFIIISQETRIVYDSCDEVKKAELSNNPIIKKLY